MNSKNKENAEQEDIKEQEQASSEKSTGETDKKTEGIEDVHHPGEEQDEIKQAEEQLIEMEAHVSELNDKFLRLYSEFENYRKRSARERIELIKNASEDVISNLLPVLDDFERAIAVNEQQPDHKTMNEGIKLIYQKLMHTVTQKGLKAMESIEKEFDPELHEAVTKIPAPSKKLKGKVVDVIEKGYYLNEKVIRYAKVVVGE